MTRSAVVGLMAAALVAGCGASHRAASSSSATGSASQTTTGPAANGAAAALHQAWPAEQCLVMQLTGQPARAADAAANTAGNQFGPANGGIGSQVSFQPASATADGNPYAQFKCEEDGSTTIFWMQQIGGGWLTMNGGMPLSSVSTAPAVGPDKYAACGKTVASLKQLVQDLAAHSDTTTLYDDYEALGLDLQLMSQQADSSGDTGTGSALYNTAAVDLADAEEVKIGGQIVDAPSDFGHTITTSCPSSQQVGTGGQQPTTQTQTAPTATQTQTTTEQTSPTATQPDTQQTPTTSFTPTPQEVAAAKAALPNCAPGWTLRQLEEEAATATASLPIQC
jgi:hypothetical protein